jgi:hypothetical protein
MSSITLGNTSYLLLSSHRQTSSGVYLFPRDTWDFDVAPPFFFSSSVLSWALIIISSSHTSTRQHAGHQRGLLLSDSTTERNCGARGDDERGVGARGHLRRNAADTTRQRAGNQRGVEKY